jgi:hypothetical protein
MKAQLARCDQAIYHSIWRFRLLMALGLMLGPVACSARQAHAPLFSYHLSQVGYQPDRLSPLTIRVADQIVQFSMAFQGGGGAYEKAQLERSGSIFKCILSDTDGKLQNMWAVYQLSGSIAPLEPGTYTLQVEEAAGRLLARGSFTIR